jgi:beta-fructofuranosidase
MNDPNDLCRMGDTWHLFYQFHPAGTDWVPNALGPCHQQGSLPLDPLAGLSSSGTNPWRLGATGGAFSGNAFQDQEGRLKFYYTERLPAYDLFEGYREIQKIAEPGRNLIKAEGITEILERCPRGVLHDFRDPKVWWDDAAGAYRMVLGASIHACPAVLLYGSSDGVSWDYLGPLYCAPAHFSGMRCARRRMPGLFPSG